ncbi:MAG: peptidoglycan DD-metalloendopeptidase family protein [Ignavibacteriales bacterium]|nr:peptidoglycan DD-metalloendopeptidase family protein [Ignavibacteriales bacterium]
MNSFIIPISAQVKNQLLQKKGELSELKAEIKQLENQLLNKTQNEQKSIEVIENFNKQKFLLNKIINTIRNEEKNKERQIINIEQQIKSIEAKIKKLKDNYAKYVVYLYKYGKQDELAMILGSESFNQALLRYKYLNKISEQRKRDLTELKDSQTELGEARIFLTNELEQKKIIADQKQKEQEELKLKIEKRRTYLASLKNDKEAIKDEIDLKRKSEDGIKRIIANLIAEEKRKAEALKRERELAKRKPKSELKTEKAPLVETDYTQNLSSFAALKGMLKWPVDNGKIIRKFGEQKNVRLNTVTLNYGVDIKTAKDKTIKAVADGIVSSVNWLPGFGSVLIISHKDDYRTVYGHLSEIFVSEGTQVLSGTSIGTVEESLEGNILHFEIWSERVNQNPEVWLR